MGILSRRHTLAGRAKDTDLAAANAGPLTDILTPSAATKTLFVTSITVSVFTYSAKTITIQDDASSPVVIGFISVPAAAATTANEQTFKISFGEKGTALTLGKNLDAVLSGAGVAARIHVEGYEK